MIEVALILGAMVLMLGGAALVGYGMSAAHTRVGVLGMLVMATGLTMFAVTLGVATE